MAVQRDKVIASAEKLVAKGKIEPAIKEYERLLEDNPNDVNTLNRIGDLWVRINNNGEAVKVFAKIAQHYAKDGFFLKAIAIYKKINKLDPSMLDVYAKLADLYAKQGLAMEAKSQYQVLADYYVKHGDPANALAIYKKISELDPNSINVHVKLADLHSASNQPAEAMKEYDRVGKMLLKRGMLDEAAQVFKKALKVEPKNTDLVESLVTAMLEAKDFDNATQITQAALELNKDNPRLLAIIGRINLARGDAGGARAALERSLAADPNDTSARETVAELSLKQNDADKALEMLMPIVEKALARGERSAAVETLNRILRVDSGHTPTLERLVGVYTRLNEETNILASMNSLAEAHIAKGRYEQAAQVLERLIMREPQNAQHRNKLQFVKSQMGGVDTMPTGAGPAPAPPPSRPAPMSMPSLEIDEPVPSFDTTEEPTDFSLDLDASAPIELDLSLDTAPAAPARPSAPPPPQHLMSAVDQAAADVGGDDLDFITEHLTEAEVFAKYGLAEKAAEHLRAVLERAPKNLTAHDRLFRILLEEGDADGARAAARAYVAVLEAAGDAATVDAVRNEFASRGIAFGPAPAAAPAAAPKPAPAPAPAPAPPPEPAISFPDFSMEAEPEISFDIEESGAGEIEFDIEEPAVEPVVELAVEPVEEVAEPALMFDEVDEVAEVAEVAPEPMFEQDALVDFSPGFSEPEPVAETPEPFFGVESLEAEPPVEEIGEIDFYIEQGFLDEARKKLNALLERFPSDPNLLLRQRRIASAAKAATPPAPAPPPTAPSAPAPPALSRDEIESELLSAIPDDDEDIAMSPIPAPAPAPPPPPPAAPAPAPPAISAAAVPEENLFADEEDFFDLAAELESELVEDEEQLSLSEEEQSLEEIFKEFKKGVEQQLDSEDYDTHYNLGIAYKEMGLIDEAIGEFQLASKDPKRAVECASMLGLCFLEKGMPQLAIKWYRKGLEMPEITEEEHVGLLYDLGSAYQEVGDTDNAQKAFMEVYGMNSNYRDIVVRIKQLEELKK